MIHSATNNTTHGRLQPVSPWLSSLLSAQIRLPSLPWVASGLGVASCKELQQKPSVVRNRATVTYDHAMEDPASVEALIHALQCEQKLVQSFAKLRTIWLDLRVMSASMTGK